MGRKAEPGISYYPKEVNHILHKKVRLLFHEFDSDGYWIWNCLLSKIYSEKGYYLDISNAEEMELFATDVCKKKVSLVKEVIIGCLRRDLFNQAVFDAFEILTSDRIQMNYLHATCDRRKKGTAITLIRELLLVEEDEDWKNVNVLGINEILPGKKAKSPGNNPQSIVKKSIVKNRKVKDGADAPPDKSFKNWTEQEFIDQIAKYKDQYPYEMRNAFYKYWKEKSPSGKMKFQLQKTWETDLRLNKWRDNDEKFKTNGNKVNSGNSQKPIPEPIDEGGAGHL